MLEKIRELPGDVIDAAGKVLLAGLGAMTLAQERSAALAELYDTLVRKGLAVAPDRTTLAGTLKSVGDGAIESVDSVKQRVTVDVGAAMQRVNLPTESEINLLTGKVEALGKALEKLRAQRERAAVTPASKQARQIEMLALEPPPPLAPPAPAPKTAPAPVPAAPKHAAPAAAPKAAPAQGRPGPARKAEAKHDSKHDSKRH